MWMSLIAATLWGKKQLHVGILFTFFLLFSGLHTKFVDFV